MFGLKPPHQAVEDREATYIEKNVLLVNLLRNAGFEAHPVLISTKSNGKFREKWEKLTQFDHLIVLLRVGGESYFLDTSNRYCPFGLLPADDLNGKGLLVKEEGGEIIEIPRPREISTRRITTTAVLDGEGNLQCRTAFSFMGSENVRERRTYDEKEAEEYVEGKLKDRYADVEVDSFEVRNGDDIESPFELVVDYRLPAFAQVAGDMLYLTPPLLNRLESNPFPTEKRTFPVEYNCGLETEEEVHLSLPEGYRIVETPGARNVRGPGLMYSSDCMEIKGDLQFTRYYRRSEVTFQPMEYKEVRGFYSEVIGCDKANLVLGR